MKLKDRKPSANVSEAPNLKPAVARAALGSYGNSRKSARYVPGGVQGANAMSKALMGNTQTERMTEAAARDAIAAFKKRSLPSKSANPFDKAKR